jgi:hypothetical protein
MGGNTKRKGKRKAAGYRDGGQGQMLLERRDEQRDVG